MTDKKHQKKESGRISCDILSDSLFPGSLCSAADCTGLIPAMPSTEEEQAAYEEMYAFCTPPANCAVPAEDTIRTQPDDA